MSRVPNSGWIEIQNQILQTARQDHLFQTLVEVISKSQILQAVRQGHVFQTPGWIEFQKLNSADC